MNRLRLTGMRMTGPNAPTAEVMFNDGLNVITGPSDTGKSFIFQCINYALGSKKTIKNIPEASAYDKVWIGLLFIDDNQEYVLEKNIKKRQICLHKVRFVDGHFQHAPYKIFNEQDKYNENTASNFLLNLTGLSNKQIRINNDGKLRKLNFQDLINISIIDKESMITKNSLIYSGKRKNIADNSILKLIISDKDDSDLEDFYQKKQPASKTRIDAKTEIVDEIITEYNNEINVGTVTENEDDINLIYEDLEIKFNNVTENMNRDQTILTDAENNRQKEWGKLNALNTKLRVHEELLARFALLKKQYYSEIDRLNAVSETAYALALLTTKPCPLCGAEPQMQNHHHLDEHELPNIQASGQREAQKIAGLLPGLEATILEAQKEESDLQEEIQQQTQLVKQWNDKIKKELEPRIHASILTLKEITSKQIKLRRAMDLYAKIDSLQEKRRQLDQDRSLKATKPEWEPLPSQDINNLCILIRNLLHLWRLFDIKRIFFDMKNEDFIVNGKNHNDHGTGVKAIIHSAFNIALLRYCIEQDRPHLGFVMLDSPLTGYKEAETELHENAHYQMKTAFYRSLAQRNRAGQIIILDNEIPPIDVASQINHIHFTKSNTGRYGFIDT
ncbi:MAG: hypothetical protein H7839_01120 [Magnetococcus sp. YQC-5]